MKELIVKLNELSGGLVFTLSIIMWVMVLVGLEVLAPAGSMVSFWVVIIIAILINTMVLINLWNNTWVGNINIITKILKSIVTISSILFAPSLVAWAGYTWYLRTHS